jgi:hypothetical protein
MYFVRWEQNLVVVGSEVHVGFVHFVGVVDAAHSGHAITDHLYLGGLERIDVLSVDLPSAD